MRKGIILSCVLFLLCGCALLPRRATEIVWPGKVDRMEALCDIDVAWKDMNYSGSMSVSLDYPSKFRLEVYGPFGDTIVFMSKEGEKFVLVAGEERFTDEKAFEEKFDIRLRDFIDDIAVRGEGEAGIQGSGGTVVRDRYRVVYNLGGKTSSICWEGREGKICVRFLEARFNNE